MLFGLLSWAVRTISSFSGLWLEVLSSLVWLRFYKTSWQKWNSFLRVRTGKEAVNTYTVSVWKKFREGAEADFFVDRTNSNRRNRRSDSAKMTLKNIKNKPAAWALCPYVSCSCSTISDTENIVLNCPTICKVSPLWLLLKNCESRRLGCTRSQWLESVITEVEQPWKHD